MKPRRIPSHGLAIGLLLLCGCGGQESSVSGTVTLDGEPLPCGAISFHAVNAGPTAVGQIDEHGFYEIKTGDALGLPAGEYDITVVATEPPAPSNGFDSPSPGRLITPLRYGSPETSKLRKTVQTGANRIDLDL